ncbi:probable cyclic nucleotide-gated ion channel 5 [Impatiens glandulifera]|uniref:probable cyclic nucleotide-gated ion channel 5 n=1 Tax=Impatiens glandulifera TaxID=253017 RepID=UPI001FB0E226|nr:probable cyclic nucleotide-gated ion channel 5 [Impatiens glandulifera]
MDKLNVVAIYEIKNSKRRRIEVGLGHLKILRHYLSSSSWSRKCLGSGPLGGKFCPGLTHGEVEEEIRRLENGFNNDSIRNTMFNNLADQEPKVEHEMDHSERLTMQNESSNGTWIWLFGLPSVCWSTECLRNAGEALSGYREMDENTRLKCEVGWERICVSPTEWMSSSISLKHGMVVYKVAVWPEWPLIMSTMSTSNLCTDHVEQEVSSLNPPSRDFKENNSFGSPVQPISVDKCLDEVNNFESTGIVEPLETTFFVELSSILEKDGRDCKNELWSPSLTVELIPETSNPSYNPESKLCVTSEESPLVNILINMPYVAMYEAPRESLTHPILGCGANCEPSDAENDVLRPHMENAAQINPIKFVYPSYASDSPIKVHELSEEETVESDVEYDADEELCENFSTHNMMLNENKSPDREILTKESEVWPDIREISTMTLIKKCQMKKIGDLPPENFFRDHLSHPSVICRYSSEPTSLWATMIKCKYGNDWSGWFTKHINRVVGCGIWSGISVIWKTFREQCRFSVGDGSSISFWEDVWCSAKSLYSLFPTLASIAICRDATVKDMFDMSSNGFSTRIRYMRRLIADELALHDKVLNLVGRKEVNPSSHDIMRWQDIDTFKLCKMFGCGFKSQIIDGQRKKFVRLDSNLSFSSDAGVMKNCGFNLDGLTGSSQQTNNTIPSSKSFRVGISRGSEGLKTIGRSLKSGVNRVVFQEDLNLTEKKIFDPQDKIILFCNRVLVISCIIAVSIDPLFLYVAVFDYEQSCLGIDSELAHTVTTSRTLIDSFYLIRIVLQFRTAYIAPSSRVFGRGELVIDPAKIAERYLNRYFIFDLLSVMPFPQIVVWKFLADVNGSSVMATKQALIYIIIFQYIPRFFRFLPLTNEMRKTNGHFAETAWAGAAYYMLWFMLASHIFGAFWYLFAVGRTDNCWEEACSENLLCIKSFLYCENNGLEGYLFWKDIARGVLSAKCYYNENDPKFNYGIYGLAVSSGIIATKNFIPKYLYCLWWGLQNLSTLGQGLETSLYPAEVIFSITIAVFGLILFALLIGNMQTYLQSLTVRLEEMRIKRRDSEQWMHHRLLPQELRERVRRYDQYKWLETKGVDEETIVQSLPMDLRRDIKRHLCLNLVKRVPLFANMDDQLLDAVCERLKPTLYTNNTYAVREGDPVDEMLFIIRGRLESVTTDGGRSGFFNRGFLKENDFCGEELLTWALDPKSASNLPPSTRTVKALSEVEAFALSADELKFITTQFRRLHSRQVQQTFRFYSQQWRTWAACFIMAAWRRHSRRKMAERRSEGLEEDWSSSSSFDDDDDNDEEEERELLRRNRSRSGFGAAMLASRFATNALRGVKKLRKKKKSSSSRGMVKVPKPQDPDFEADLGDFE